MHDPDGHQQLVNNMAEKLWLFKLEVCRKKCQLCSKGVKPEFCQFLFETDSEVFTKEIVIPLMILRERKPRFLKELREPEGFKALFCENEALCSQFRSPQCMNRADCYQFFVLQDGMALEKGEDLAILASWDHAKYRECIQEIRWAKNLFNTGLRPKRRKKLLKLIKKLGNLYRSIGKSPKKNKKKGAHKPANQPKKVVTTKFFCRWPEKFAPVFNEGESADCASKSETG